MLLRKVANELALVRGYKTLYEMLGMWDYPQVNNFCSHETKTSLLGRHLDCIKDIARLLDVPTSFIIRILQLEAIDK